MSRAARQTLSRRGEILRDYDSLPVPVPEPDEFAFIGEEDVRFPITIDVAHRQPVSDFDPVIEHLLFKPHPGVEPTLGRDRKEEGEEEEWRVHIES